MANKNNQFRNMSKEQLISIINNPKSSESDIIIASIEKGHRDIEEGNYYTTEEIIKYFNNMAREC